MKRIKSIITLLTLPIISFSFAASASAVDTPWGPERPTFTWEDPAPYATFNSITNNPDIGDERNFVRIRELKDGEKYGDEVNLEVGKIYEVYIYYHNNADAHDVGTTAIGIADGAAMKSSFPAIVRADERASVTATVFASDTNPLAVWDGAYVRSSRDVYLRYIPGTAIIHNGGKLNGSDIGPDYLFGDGALLGYNIFSGLLPGCNQYAGYVTYQFFVDAPDFEVTKTVVDGSTTVKPGDEVTFKITYDNTGTMDQTRVVMRDTLPEGMTYIPGSAIIANNNFVDGKSVNDDIIDPQGMNIGDYAGDTGWADLTYKVKISDDAKCGDKLTNSAIVSTSDGDKTASVTLTVAGDGCEITPDIPEPETPDTPTEIPNTGPAEIVMAVIIVLGIAGGGFYLWRTRHVVKTVEKHVTSGAKNHDTASDNHVPDSANHDNAKNAKITEVENSSKNHDSASDNHDQAPENHDKE